MGTVRGLLLRDRRRVGRPCMPRDPRAMLVRDMARAWDQAKEATMPVRHLNLLGASRTLRAHRWCR